MYKIKAFGKVKVGSYFLYWQKLWYKDSTTTASQVAFENGIFCNEFNCTDFESDTEVVPVKL